MKNLFKRSLLVLMILAMLALTACDSKSDSKSDFKTGSFDGTVFTNEWANMKFTFPEDIVIASQDEIKDLMKQGNAGLYADDEKLEKAINKAAELKLAYDFLVSNADGTLNFQLFYENLSLSIGGTNYTEKKYLDTSLEPVLANKDLGYELLNEGTRTIAGKEFLCYSLSGYNGIVMQDMYCYKQDNRMIIFAVTYTPDKEKEAADIVDKISVAK